MAETLTQIQALIVHEVPRRLAGTTGTEPVLSDVPSSLNDELATYFLEKIAGTLRIAAFPVVYDESTTSPVPGLTGNFFAGTKDLVTISRDMAAHLYACQTGVNSPGLLVVIDGRAGLRKALTIMKLEKEEGVRVRLQRTHGHMTFDIAHLRDLMLTQSTRVFKVGVFPRHGIRPRDMAGDVSDNQRGYQPESEIADFFLRRFLGCRLRDTPDVVTKTFFEATERFINERVVDPEMKARYETALMAEMNSEDHIVDPIAFARRHLEASDRDGFLDEVRGTGITAAQFVKDIAQIANRVRRIVLSFESKVRVYAPSNEVGNSVQVEAEGDRNTVVTVRGQLDRIHGR